MKKLIFIIPFLILCLSVVSCDTECIHVYDNDCDTECNECGEARSPKEHVYKDADCNTPKTCTVCGITDGTITEHVYANATCTAPKICSLCGSTDGTALGHNAEADDGDCTTAINCSGCGEIMISGNSRHISDADDGDCSTCVTCTNCETVITASKNHNFSANWQIDTEAHLRICTNEGCTVTDTKEAHIKGDDGICIECGYVIEFITPHNHEYTVTNYDETHHWLECICSEIDDNTVENHDSTDDGDCTTPVICPCGYTVKTATSHIPESDDGSCITDVICVNCDQIAISGASEHLDNNGDRKCDNTGCQFTFEAPPENEPPNIDFPLVPI